MDKFKRMFQINKKVFVFLFGITVIGVIFGSCLPLFLNSQDKALVGEYLSDFITQINSGYNSLLLFKNGFFNNFIFSFLIWILGISIIGFFVILFLYFFKCFIFGFSISSIIINYGFKGILFSFVYIFPHQVINLFIYCFLTSYSLIFSINLLGLIFKKNNFNIRNSFIKYFKFYLISLLVFLISSLYDSFVNPIILGFVFKLLGI